MRSTINYTSHKILKELSKVLINTVAYRKNEKPKVLPNTCMSKSGSLNSRADATDATDAFDTDSSEEEDVASAGACDLDLRLPLFLPRFAQQGT